MGRTCDLIPCRCSFHPWWHGRCLYPNYPQRSQAKQRETTWKASPSPSTSYFCIMGSTWQLRSYCQVIMDDLPNDALLVAVQKACSDEIWNLRRPKAPSFAKLPHGHIAALLQLPVMICVKIPAHLESSWSLPVDLKWFKACFPEHFIVCIFKPPFPDGLISSVQHPYQRRTQRALKDAVQVVKLILHCIQLANPTLTNKIFWWVSRSCTFIPVGSWILSESFRRRMDLSNNGVFFPQSTG